MMIIATPWKFLLFGLIQLLPLTTAQQSGPYEPEWSSLDSRPLPGWYDEVKIGIFIHWGVFSVPSYRSEWFWNYWKEERYDDVVQFMKKNYPPDFTYQDFAPDFTAEFFEPKKWVDVFETAGAKYVVLTTKHHEGFTLWPSAVSFGWNAGAVGPKRDLVGELAQAVRNSSTRIRFGAYHSLFEWYNPLWLQDEEANFSTRTYAETKAIPELYELVNAYKPDIIWSDGDAEANDTYWGSKEFLAWLYNDSPIRDEVVVNDRWGGTSCQHGGFFNCADRFSPGVLQTHKWENALTIDRYSWGYRRDATLDQHLTIEEIIEQVVQTVSCGGNVLINIGPTKEGTISAINEERLRQLGSWLSINGEAIYGTKPWIAQNDTLNGNVWYTQKEDKVYGLILGWPNLRTLAIDSPSTLFQGNSTVQLLSYENNLPFNIVGNITIIEFPDKALVASEWAYVIRLNNLKI